MKDRVQGCVTAGVALVGAGVMAVSPVAPQAPEVLRSVNAEVALAAALTGTPAENLALSAQRTVTGLVGAPIGFATAAIALAQGGPVNNAAAYAILEEIVDGPLWAADPAIYAFDDLLPAPIGGSPGNVQEQRGTSLITQFRADELIAARDDVNEAIRDSLGVGTATQLPGNEVSPAYAAARLWRRPRSFCSARSYERCHRATRAGGRRTRAAAEFRGETTSRCTRHSRPTSTGRITSPIRLCSPSTMCSHSLSVAIPQTNPALMNGSEISRLRGMFFSRLGMPSATSSRAISASTRSRATRATASTMQLNGWRDTTERNGPVAESLTR